MSEVELDAKQIERKVSDLADAMERVRDDQAARDDVVIEMKQARIARLELLAKDLQPLFKDVPDDNEQFEFALTNGENPRLWIDMTSYIRMGRDRREYEFVKDTRMGRTILGHSEDRERMTKMVSNYVAERILERERMIEGEWVAMRDYNFDQAGGAETAENGGTAKGRGFGEVIAWFVLGIAAGAVALLAWQRYGAEVMALIQ